MFTIGEKFRGKLAVRGLSKEAQEYYNETAPLEVYERNGAYYVRGCTVADNLTLQELEELFSEEEYEEYGNEEIVMGWENSEGSKGPFMPVEACIAMFSGDTGISVINPHGCYPEEVRLTAYAYVSDYEEETGKKVDDIEELDDWAYPRLVEEIKKQAKKYGIDESRLVFPYDGE